MQCGTISFADRIAYNIKQNEIKREILDDLEHRFHIKILQRHWHKFDEVAQKHIRSSLHYLSLRSNGNPYFLYLTRYQDVPLIFFVDKKIQPNYHMPRIILGRGLFDDALFDNTVLDGEMVKASNGSWMFLINDIHAYCNQWLENYPLSARLAYVIKILEQQYTPDPNLDVCTFQIKRYLPCNLESFHELCEWKNVLPYTSRGIYFWPSSLKMKPKLHNFDENLIQTVQPKIKEKAEFREMEAQPDPDPVPMPMPMPKPQENASHQNIFYIRKTENPDVFEMFDRQQKAVGIASIPYMKTSKMLYDIFKEQNLMTMIPFECEYSQRFQKWVPVTPLLPSS